MLTLQWLHALKDRIHGTSQANGTHQKRRLKRRESFPCTQSETLEDRALLAAAIDFDFDTIASNLDPALRFFGSPNAADAPFQIIRYGEGTVTSITGLPGTSSLIPDPTDLTYSFGSDDVSNPVEVVTLSSFDDGLSDGLANQIYTPDGVNDVPALTLFYQGNPIGVGALLKVSLQTTPGQVVTSPASAPSQLELTAPIGADTSIYDGLIAATGGTGVIDFTMTPFNLTGPWTGIGDAQRFTSTGTFQGLTCPDPAINFDFTTISSDLHPTFRAFGSLDPNDAPFSIIRYGEGTGTDIIGLPDLNALVSSPGDLTYSFGSNNVGSPVEVVTLSTYDDGLGDGLVNQIYTPDGVDDVPTLTVFNSGVAVATGSVVEISLEVTMAGVVTSPGSAPSSFQLTAAAGGDTSIFDELMSASNGSGLFDFTLNAFANTGPWAGVGDAEIFTSTGSVVNLITPTPPVPQQININPTGSSFPYQFVDVNGTVFFMADDGTNGSELWKSDGTIGGTQMVKNIDPTGSSYPYHLLNVNGTLFFTASDGTNGYELWRSDGTTAETVLVEDIRTGDSSFPSDLTNVNGTLFFTADDGVNGRELWKLDGSDAVMVKDIDPAAGEGSGPSYLTNVNGTLFFSADDGINGPELWKSDGTSAGTQLIKNINPANDSYSYPEALTAFNGSLFFTADDGTNGIELWKSDGTTAGTQMVKNINPTADVGADPYWLTVVGGTLFFSAEGDSGGDELWKSDGTSGGTVLVKNINPTSGSYPRRLTNVDGTLFFSATDGIDGLELWKSDGTSGGTVLVKNINTTPGYSGSYPYALTNVNGTLYFHAEDPVNGRELWESDGTSSGTNLVADIAPGIDSSANLFGNILNANGTLFFSADNLTDGVELWTLSTGSAPQPATVELSVSTTTASESGATQIVVTATASTFVHGDQHVDLAISGTGIMAADYGLTFPQLTIPDGQTSSSTTFTVVDDGIVEDTELALFEILNPSSGLTLGTTVTQSVSIQDDDAATFAIDDLSVSEADGTATFTVSLDAPIDIALVVDVTLGGGTATGGGDDFNGGESLTFSAESTASQQVVVAISNDNTVELTETFLAMLGTSASLGTRSVSLTDTGTGTITDDDSATVTIAGISTDEATGTATFTLSLDNPIDTNVTIDVGLTDGTAVGGNVDYDSTTQNVVVTANSTTQQFTVPVNNDNIVELSEAFTAAISTATPLGTRVVTVSDSAIATITNDDSATVSIADLAMNEGHYNDVTGFTFTVSLSNPVDGPVTLQVDSSDGTATLTDSDYAALVAAPISFAALEQTKTVTVNVNGNLFYEDDETFLVDLSNLNVGGLSASFGDAQAIGTILNDEIVEDQLGLLTAAGRVPGNVFAGEQGTGMAIVPDANDNAVYVFTDGNGDIVVQGIGGSTVNGAPYAVLFPGAGAVTGTARVFASTDTMLTAVNNLSVAGLQVFGGAASEALELSATTVTANLTVNLTDGDNSLLFKNGTGAASKSTVVSGSGNDLLELRGAAFGTINNLETGAGNDTLILTNANFAGSVSVKTGAGNDMVTGNEVTVGNSFSLNGEADNDTITLDQMDVTLVTVVETGEGTNSASVLNGTFNTQFFLNTKSGADTVQLSTSDFLTSVNINTGGGTNDINLFDVDITGATSVNAFLGSADIELNQVDAGQIMFVRTGVAADVIDVIDGTFAQQLNINSNAGDDQVSLNGTQITGQILLSTLAGLDTISLTNVTGLNQLLLNSGSENDTVTLDQSSIAANTTLVTEGGNDMLSIMASTFNAVSNIKTGFGNDTVSISQATAFNGNTSIKTEAGEDTLTGNLVTTTAAITIDTGTDDDVADLMSFTTSQPFAVQPGSGNDALRLTNFVTTSTVNVSPLSGNNVIDLQANGFGDHVQIATANAHLGVRNKNNSFTTVGFIASASINDDVLLDNGTSTYATGPTVFNFDDLSNTHIDAVFSNLLGLLFP